MADFFINQYVPTSNGKFCNIFDDPLAKKNCWKFVRKNAD